MLPLGTPAFPINTFTEVTLPASAINEYEEEENDPLACSMADNDTPNEEATEPTSSDKKSSYEQEQKNKVLHQHHEEIADWVCAIHANKPYLILIEPQASGEIKIYISLLQNNPYTIPKDTIYGYSNNRFWPYPIDSEKGISHILAGTYSTFKPEDELTYDITNCISQLTFNSSLPFAYIAHNGKVKSGKISCPQDKEQFVQTIERIVHQQPRFS